MARFNGSAGILPAIKSICILCLMLCLCLAFSTTVAKSAERIDWTAVPLTEDAQVQSYVALCRAVYWRNMGNSREVKRQLEAAIRLDPRSSFLHVKLAEASYNLPAYSVAQSECETALELNPDNADAHYLLGLLNFIRYDVNRRKPVVDKFKRVAIDEFKAATTLNPEHLKAQHYLAAMLYNERDYPGAAKAYSEMVKLKPYDHRLRNRLGVCYSRSNKTEKAIKEFNAAARIHKDYLEPHFHLAYLYAGQSRNKEAVEECLWVLKRSPGDVSINLLLSEIYVSMDEFDKAIPRAQGVLRAGKAEKTMAAEAYYRLATAYKGKGRASLADSHFRKSIDLYKEILEADQKNVKVHYGIAMVYDARGDFNLAEQHLREYIRLDPDEPDVHNFLGYTFLQHDVNLEEAVALIKKAVAMQPQNGAFRDSLGWAYFKQGNLDEAIGELEKAAELIPDDSDIREHLGEAYLKKGGEFVEEAVLEWEKALEIRPKNTSLRQRLGKLRSALEQKEEGTKEP